MTQDTDVLIAIDGTDSEIWQDGTNSHVLSFCQDFRSQRKVYFHGPNDTILGRDSEEIAQGAMQWIRNELRIQEDWRPTHPTNPASGTPLEGLFERKHLHRVQTPWGGAQKPGLPADPYKHNLCGPGGAPRVSIVGHSRGGMIGMAIAKRLRVYGLRVQFLGLYDAVDRSPVHAGSRWHEDRVVNVLRTVHARRGREGSRISFGATGTQSEGEYEEAFFDTSHGGIGGSPFPTNSTNVPDRSCMNRGPLRHSTKGQVRPVRSYSRDETCLGAALLADRWMRRMARLSGLPIPELDSLNVIRAQETPLSI